MERETRKIIELGSSKVVTLPREILSSEDKEAILYIGKKGVLITFDRYRDFFELHKEKVKYLLESGI